MPKRAIVACLLSLFACGESGSPPTAADASQSLCGGRVQSGADYDPEAGSWRLLVPPHGQGASGKPVSVDAVLDGCGSFASVAHDAGPGGKIYQPGPAQLLWSADGQRWESRDMSTQAFFRSLAFGAGTWVAVGERTGAGVISVSKHADASQWREVFGHSMYFRSVAYGAGKFVAVTQAGIAVSGDGESWHWATLPDTRALYFEVAYGAGRFVVAGVGATLSSLDGETWTLSGCGGAGCPAIQPPSGPASTTIALQEIRWAAGAFYAFGGSGQLRSRDGVTFEPYVGARVPELEMAGKLLSLVQTPGEAATALAVSKDDGQTWSELPLQAASASADCAREICLVAGESLLIFDPR